MNLFDMTQHQIDFAAERHYDRLFDAFYGSADEWTLYMSADEMIRFLEDTGAAEEEFRDWADTNVSEEQMALFGYPDEEDWDKEATWADIWQKAPERMKAEMAEALIRRIEGDEDSEMRNEYNLWAKNN